MADDTSKAETFSVTTTLLLAEPCVPAFPAMVSEIAKVDPIKVVPMSQDESMIVWKGNCFIASVGKTPIPRHVYHSIAASTVFWPEAAAELAHHKATVQLTSRVARGNLIDGLVEQTVLVRCFMEHLPVLGVLWAQALTKPDWFDFLFQRLQHTGRLPIPAWVQIQMSWERGKTLASTNGMGALGLMEVECNFSPLAPDPTLDVVQDFIGYLLAEGPVMRDGGTFELGAASKAYDGIIRVHHAPSFRSADRTVYLLEFI